MKVSKNAQRKMNSTRPSKKYSPQILKSLHNPNVMKVGDHIFDNGTVVPIFEVSDYRALNQVIGYAKFLNTNYGDVFYRGEVHLHKTLLPSISRKTNINQCTFQLNQAIDSAITDEKFSKTAKLSGFKGRQTPRLIVEAMLQHYGYSTHFIDLVDNHWVALWFGLNSFKKMQSLSTYYYYQSRQVNPVELIGLNEITNELYQYMLLVAVDNNAAPVERGIYIGNDTIVIDLRSSLPSVFLRPHAQHGLVVRKNTHEPQESFDLASNVVGIVRLRIDNVMSWIGNGDLVASGNLFPPPAYDYGYEILLKREDLFLKDAQQIIQYI